MYCIRVRSELADRLDAEFYAPVALETVGRLNANGPALTLGNAIADGYRVVYHGIDQCPPGTPTIPFLSPTQIGDDGELDFEITSHVPSYYRQDYPKGLASPGELLVEVKGNAAKVAVVPEEFPDGLMISGSLYKAAIGPDFDSRFLVAFLRGRHGQVLKARLTSNTIIDYIAKDALYSIPLPGASLPAQRFIGGKVRQAERLRERARRLLDGVRQHQNNLIPSFQPTREKWNTFRLSSSAVEDVIVPHFYPPAVTEYLAGRHIRSLGQLCENVYSGETYDPDDQGVDQATSRSCSGRFLRRPCNRVRPPTRTDLDLQPHDLLLTNAAHEKGYIGTDVTYYHGGPRNIPSAKVMVLRPNRTLVPASYVFTYLQTSVGYLQIQSAIRGISAGIRAEDVASIHIPLPTLTEQECATWAAMDTKMAEAGAAEETASLLCAAASQIVEQLVDGRLTEADLVAAQKALEAGDRSVDREILKSLRESDAPDAKPLIADVDALYAILDGSEGHDP